MIAQMVLLEFSETYHLDWNVEASDDCEMNIEISDDEGKKAGELSAALVCALYTSSSKCSSEGSC